MALTIQDDMIEAAMLLPKEERNEFYGALVEYSIDKTEPDYTDFKPWHMAFKTCMKRIDLSNKKRANGKKGAEKLWNKTPDNQAIIANSDSAISSTNDSANKAKQKVAKMLSRDEMSREEMSIEEKSRGESVRGETRAPRKKFCKPSIEEIEAYVSEKGYHVNAKKFWNYYESQGWKVGKNPMKSWHSALATWEQREGVQDAKPNPFPDVKPSVIINVDEQIEAEKNLKPWEPIPF